jgi:hypothetical protein
MQGTNKLIEYLQSLVHLPDDYVNESKKQLTIRSVKNKVFLSTPTCLSGNPNIKENLFIILISNIANYE